MHDKIQFSHNYVNERKPQSELDLNVLAVNLRDILKSEPTIKFRLFPEMKIMCTQCEAIISFLSKRLKSDINEWQCELCGHKNETNILDWDSLIKYDDIEFTTEEDELFNTYENSNLKSDERIIIFCIDTSGSMAGPRINSVKNACLKTIEQLCNQDNSKIKVALVTFDSTSKYYGNGDLNESTITKQNWYDKSEQTMGKIKQYAQELLTVNKSATLIKHRLEKLDADGGTSICDALAHSVLLASMAKSSFIVLCTDGCAADSDEKFYSSIIDYCNEHFLKISIVSFEGADCNLSMLGRCACETGGKISQTLLNGSDLDAHFIEIIGDNLKNSLFKNKGPISLNIISNRDCVTLNNSSYKFSIQSLNTNTNEILLEYTINEHGSFKDNIAFQVQIKTSKSIRIITKQICFNSTNEMPISNEHLIHVYCLRKLSQLCIENKNMVRAKEFLKKYQKFLENEATKKKDLCDVTVKLFNRLPIRQNFRFLNDCDAQIIYNNKNLSIDEFVGINEKHTDSATAIDASQELVPIESITISQSFVANEPNQTLPDTSGLIQTSISELQMYNKEQNLEVASFKINVNVLDNFQFINNCENIAAKKTINHQSLKMIMIALKMIKQATGICMKARNLLDMNYLHSPMNASNKSREFLKQIFDNISETESLVNGLSSSSSVLVQKDFDFINKMFKELNVYLELDILGCMQQNE